MEDFNLEVFCKKPIEKENYSFLRSLYEKAFPIYERRNWKQLQSILQLPNMHIIIAKQNEKPVGFAIYWKIEIWFFLEHLAIHPQQEGKGYGSQLLQWLLQQSSQNLLLEAELPSDEISQRRIRFYQKAGLQIATFPYQQPPYRRGETTPAMHIMSVPQITDAALFNHITSAIRQQVFEAFY